jgi:hypothetical protein
MAGPGLVFFKTKNTESGAHTATATSGFSLHAARCFGSADKDNGWFQIATEWGKRCA